MRIKSQISPVTALRHSPNFLANSSLWRGHFMHQDNLVCPGGKSIGESGNGNNWTLIFEASELNFNFFSIFQQKKKINFAQIKRKQPKLLSSHGPVHAVEIIWSSSDPNYPNYCHNKPKKTQPNMARPSPEHPKKVRNGLFLVLFSKWQLIEVGVLRGKIQS